MKAPVCMVCNTFSADNEKDDWVTFKNYKRDPNYVPWHPDGMEFFCAEHIDAARELLHLDSDEAIEILKAKYPMAQVQTPVSPPARRSLASFFARMWQKLR